MIAYWTTVSQCLCARTSTTGRRTGRRPGRSAVRRLEQLERVAVGVLDLHLPAAGLLLPAIRQRPGSGSARAAQDQPQLAGRDLGKRRQLLHVTGEAERLCVERHGPRDV